MCSPCQGERYERQQAANNTTSAWEPRSSQPPNVGVVAGTDDVVSFKTGGPTGDDTLIADGDFSDNAKGFSRNSDGSKGHDHYGSWGGTNRGTYTGPDS